MGIREPKITAYQECHFSQVVADNAILIATAATDDEANLGTTGQSGVIASLQETIPTSYTKPRGCVAGLKRKTRLLKGHLSSFVAQITFNLEELWIYLLLAPIPGDEYANHYHTIPVDNYLPRRHVYGLRQCYCCTPVTLILTATHLFTNALKCAVHTLLLLPTMWTKRQHGQIRVTPPDRSSKNDLVLRQLVFLAQCFAASCRVYYNIPLKEKIRTVDRPQIVHKCRYYKHVKESFERKLIYRLFSHSLNVKLVDCSQNSHAGVV